MNRLIILVCAFIISSCNSYSQQKTSTADSNTAIHILFIGNSLTYTNNLPELVQAEAKRQGIVVVTKTIAFPNYAIIDHWNDRDIQKLIASKTYKYVIIQQGPSSQTIGRTMLIEDGKKLSRICELNNAKLCYFMVWPSRNNYHTFDDVIKNHKDAASINNALLLPVGEVWKDHFDRTNNFQYYGSDGFHPSLVGSQKAAEVIVDYLFPE